MEDGCVEVTSQIRKKIIKRGEPGRRPSLDWSCSIEVDFHDEGESEKWRKECLEVRIGDGCTPIDRLIERCLETMLVEERSLFILKLGKTQKVTIYLKSFKERPYVFEWTDEEKIKVSNHYKKRGIDLFKENEIEEAFFKFSQAIKLLITLNSILENDEPGQDVNNLRIALYNNLAQCHLHFNHYSSVIELCTKSLDLNSTPKALYRRATAFMQIKEYEKAEKDLIDLLKIEPKNKAAMEKYKMVRELDRTNRENYQAVIKKMFN